MNESYNCLLTEADAVREEGIQDVFRLKVECHKLNDSVECHTSYVQPCDSVAVKTLAMSKMTGKRQHLHVQSSWCSRFSRLQPLTKYLCSGFLMMSCKEVKSLTLPFQKFSLL